MIDDLVSFHHVGPVLSSLVMDGLATLGFGAAIAHALVHRARKRREARAADASADVNPHLAPGPAIVFGRVEYAQGARIAVRVDIDQEGDESESSGVWSHKWTEKNRRVRVEPFYLRIDPNKRIRVEPTRDVFLVDAMDGMMRVNLTKRIKFAQLTPDERVYASGELVRSQDPEAATGHGGYRSARDSLVLRPLPRTSMLLSSEPLGARYRARAAFYTKAAFLGILFALVFHATFGGFHLRRFIGETTPVPISKLEQYTTQNDEGTDIDHYRVWVTLPSGLRVADNVNEETFKLLHVEDIVPIRLVAGGYSHMSTIGPSVTAPISAFVIVPLLLFTWFLYRHREKASRPWYEREVIDTGSGRLEETLAKEQAKSKARS